jgi:hypothetical protein
MFIAPDTKSFQQLFIKKLHEMLSPDELGAFILVLANSMQDESTCSALRDELANTFGKLTTALKEGSLRAAPDDLEVFRRLIQTGINDYSAWTHIDKGEWLQYFNPLRALRPQRASVERVIEIKKAFNPDSFNFNKPFLEPEMFWKGMLSSGDENIACNVLYNKFPFLPYHFLFVPESEACHEQYLTRRFHRLVWDICMSNQENLGGIGFGYNSVGACASVNHMHLQGFLFDEPLPIERDHWKHNDGDDDYPMQCYVFSNIEESWQFIESLHEKNQPYNLLYRPGKCYILLLQMQGSTSVREHMSGAGWIEACGVFSEADKDALNNLTAKELFADIQSLSA